MKEYKITKERLEAMAKKCPEAKEVLKEGFPEAFMEEKWEDITGSLRIKVSYDHPEGFIFSNNNIWFWGKIEILDTETYDIKFEPGRILARRK